MSNNKDIKKKNKRQLTESDRVSMETHTVQNEAEMHVSLVGKNDSGSSMLSPLGSFMSLLSFDDVFKGDMAAGEGYDRLPDRDKARLKEKAQQIEFKMQEL